MKGSLLILQVKKKPRVFGGAAAANAAAPAPKAAPPKLPTVPRKVRRAATRRCATRLRLRASIALPPKPQGVGNPRARKVAIIPAADA